jgi:hypothetical protein
MHNARCLGLGVGFVGRRPRSFARKIHQTRNVGIVDALGNASFVFRLPRLEQLAKIVVVRCSGRHALRMGAMRVAVFLLLDAHRFLHEG